MARIGGKGMNIKECLIMKCVKGLEVCVLNSPAGYYVGTIDQECFPNCRLSQEYYKKKEEAQTALNNRTFTLRTCIENQFCAPNGCFNRVKRGGV